MIVEYFSNKSNEGTQKYLKILLLGFLTQLAAEYGKELDLEQLDLTQIQIMEYISNHYADGTLSLIHILFCICVKLASVEKLMEE